VLLIVFTFVFKVVNLKIKSTHKQCNAIFGHNIPEPTWFTIFSLQYIHCLYNFGEDIK